MKGDYIFMETNLFDVIITGAGPAGLMAAKTAREFGLNVLVIEKFKDFSVLRRACSAQFILDDDYQDEEMKLENNQICFTKNDFKVNYDGDIVEIKNKYYFSPHKHRIHFAKSDGSAFALKFDKIVLLRGLYEECISLGVNFLLGALVHSGKDYGDYVSVEVIKTLEKQTFKGKKLIIAEGVNPTVSSKFGFTKERIHFATSFVHKFYLKGVTEFEPNSWNLFYGKAYHSNAAIIVGPSLLEKDILEFTLSGDAKLLPKDIYKELIASGPLAKQLEHAKIVQTQGCCVKAYSSLKVPYKQNVLVIGDTAAFVEVEVQGGFTCGYRAAKAVYDELHQLHGFENYTKWWQKSFEFNDDGYLQVAQGYALVPTYTDDELDYLFGLIENEVLEGTYSQYKTPKLIWGAIRKHSEKIKAEKPDVYRKMEKMNEMTLSATFHKE